MARFETSQRTISLLPFLQPTDQSPRLALTEGSSDASYPFAIMDDSAPFSRVIRGSFLTDASSSLKNVFLVLQRDMYRLKDTTFSAVTNLTIEAGWVEMLLLAMTSDSGEDLISLTAECSCDNKKIGIFAPLLFCREKKLFMPLLCPSCARELELCHDDELLVQKGLHPYSRSVRRYLYCPSCSSTEQSEFFVREREDTDPLFLSDCMDLVRRLQLLEEHGVDTDRFPCVSCAERGTCFGSTNSVRTRLTPLSFFPFHMLIVDAPALNAIDFIALLSGATPALLAEQLDCHAFPGRVFSLNSIDNTKTVNWTLFAQGDERVFPELLLLKLSLLEEVVGRVEAHMNASLRGERVWVYVPKVGRNLPAGWNFKLLFIDDLTPEASVHEIERNWPMALAQTGLFFFQILLSGRKIGESSIVEAVRQYLSEKSDSGGETGTSNLKSLCVPANTFQNSDGFKINRLYETVWDKACAAGLELLDVARGKSLSCCRDIHHSMLNILEETRQLLFSTDQLKCAPTVTDGAAEQEKRVMIRRIVSEMIDSSRAEIQQKISSPPDKRFDEVFETVILRSPAPPELLLTPKISIDPDETVILPATRAAQANTLELSSGEEELMETVVLPPRCLAQQHHEKPGHLDPFSEQPTAERPDFSKPGQEQEDLCATVMISSPRGRQRPDGAR
ncbi:MAG TPA: hypothetical protein HPP97_11460 [Desulfuromonadales bacterium]|nr:hypothetical protein [Desulfuromonadales bacterium]